MAVARSPNYPSLDLGAALEAVRPVYKAEHRMKMSREVLARHLGYSSLNGRALGKIGAVRAYGLLEGSGDELRVSEDAIHCLEAPEGDPGRPSALQRCSTRPTIFKEIASEFATLPSEVNLKFWLVKHGYTSEAAGKAAQTYLNTMRLVAGVAPPYNPQHEQTNDVAPPTIEVGDLVTVERGGVLVFPKPVRVREIKVQGDTTWVWTEGADSWTEMDTLTLDKKAEPASRQPPPPPPPLESNADHVTPKGSRKAVIPLDEGDVTLTFPAALSPESLQLLSDYLDLFFRREKRAAETKKAAVKVLYSDAGKSEGAEDPI